MTPAVLRWKTDDGQYPIVIVAQLGRDLPLGSRDVTLSLDADGSWRCTGSQRRNDARIGPCCVPSWVLVGQLERTATPDDLIAATDAAVMAWLIVGLRPEGASDVDPELVSWHREVGAWPREVPT